MIKHIPIPCDSCGCTGVLSILWKIGVFRCPSCGSLAIGTVRKVKKEDFDELDVTDRSGKY